MEWILAIGLFTFLVIKYPKFRGVVLAGIALVVLGVFLYIGNEKVQENQRKNLIPFNQIKLDEFRLRRDGYSSELSGEITNNSVHDLTNVYLKVTAYDCSGEEITRDCRIIGEDEDVDLSVYVPSGQVRALGDYGNYVYLGDMPPVDGNFLWAYEIIGTRGTPSKYPTAVSRERNGLSSATNSDSDSDVVQNTQDNQQLESSWLIILDIYDDESNARKRAKLIGGIALDTDSFDTLVPNKFAVAHAAQFKSKQEADTVLGRLGKMEAASGFVIRVGVAKEFESNITDGLLRVYS